MGQRHKRERMCAFSQPNLGCCTAELCKAIIVQLKKIKKLRRFPISSSQDTVSLIMILTPYFNGCHN